MAADSNWVFAKSFARNGIVININSLEVRGGMKRYSYAINFQRTNDVTGETWQTPYFAAFSQYVADSNSVVLTRKAEDFAAIVKEAEDWMQAELTKQREVWLENRVERDLERAKRDENPGFQGHPAQHPSTRRVGKTAKDKKRQDSEVEGLDHTPTRNPVTENIPPQ